MFIEVEQQTKEIGDSRIKESYLKNKKRRLKLFTNVVNNLTYLQKKEKQLFLSTNEKIHKIS